MKRKDKWGVVDKDLHEILPIIHTEKPMVINNLIELKKDDKKGIADRTRKELIPFIYDGLSIENEDLV